MSIIRSRTLPALALGLALSASFLAQTIDATPLTKGITKADDIVRLLAKAPKGAKAADKVIDGAKAVKKGKKLYKAGDVAADVLKYGKGMLGKLADGLADDVVEQCAKLVKEGAYMDDIAAIITKAVQERKLTDAAADIFLDDAFLRIAAKAGRITMEEADDAFHLLKGTPGLHALLRKCCSMNVAQHSGHLAEFRQALALKKKGFDIVGIGMKYHDPLKAADTDLDLLIRKGKKIFVLESKKYEAGYLKADMINGDAQSIRALSDYINGLNQGLEATPVLTINYEPSQLILKLLEQKGVKYVVGDEAEIAERLAAIADALL